MRTTTPDGTEHWFVARTRRGQELFVRDRLEEHGITYFVPVVNTLRMSRGRKVKVTVPLIPNMVFLRATKNDACALANGYGLPIFYIIDHINGGMLAVPDSQMDDFIRVITEEPDQVLVEYFNPQPGQMVRIVSGRLQGVQGQILYVEQGTYVVVSVGQLLSARVKVAKNCLELI